MTKTIAIIAAVCRHADLDRRHGPTTGQQSFQHEGSTYVYTTQASSTAVA